jgi:hypothetical protein
MFLINPYFWGVLLFFLFVIIIIYFTSSEKKYKSTIDSIERNAREIAADFASAIWHDDMIEKYISRYPDFLSDDKLHHIVSAALISALISYEIKNGKWRTELLGKYKHDIGCEGKYIIEQALGNIVENIYNCLNPDSCIEENTKKINSLFIFMDDMQVKLCSPNLKSKITATITKYPTSEKILNLILRYYQLPTLAY